jgi:hypothetical protein
VSSGAPLDSRPATLSCVMDAQAAAVVRFDRTGWVGLARSDGASVRGEKVAGTGKRSSVWPSRGAKLVYWKRSWKGKLCARTGQGKTWWLWGC